MMPVFESGPALCIVLLPLVLSTPPFCVLCHGIVGLVLCLCNRVVSSWNSGGGLCWVEGRVVRGLWFIFLSRFPLPLPLPLCVGVRGSARAAMRARTLSPNTNASLLLFALSCLFLSALLPRLSSRPAFPVIVEWR